MIFILNMAWHGLLSFPMYLSQETPIQIRPHYKRVNKVRNRAPSPAASISLPSVRIHEKRHTNTHTNLFFCQSWVIPKNIAGKSTPPKASPGKKVQDRKFSLVRSSTPPFPRKPKRKIKLFPSSAHPLRKNPDDRRHRGPRCWLSRWWNANKPKSMVNVRNLRLFDIHTCTHILDWMYVFEGKRP